MQLISLLTGLAVLAGLVVAAPSNSLDRRQDVRTLQPPFLLLL